MSRSSRLVGAGWFAGWALVAAGAIYLVPALERGDLPGLALFVLLPAVAGAVAGALVGPRLLDPAGVGHAKALGLGLLAAVLAHLVYGPLLAVSRWLADPAAVAPLGLGLASAVVGSLATGPITLPAGMVAGWLLARLRGAGSEA